MSSILSNQPCSVSFISGGEKKTVYSIFEAQEMVLGLKRDATIIIDDLSCVPDQVFSNCDYIIEVRFGNNVNRIADSAFSGDKKLERVEFSDSITDIGTGAFSRCYSLKEVVCGSGIRRIEKVAFLGDKNIKRVVLNRGLLAVGPLAFAYCPSLEKIECHFDKQCLIDVSAFHGSLQSYEVCSTIGRIVHKETSTEHSWRVYPAGSKARMRKSHLIEHKRLTDVTKNG